MIYVTGGDGVSYGKIDIDGNLQLHSRGDTEFYHSGGADPNVLGGESGVVIWQDRDNHNLANFGGNANADITGTIYLGYNPVKIAGDPDNFGNQLIAGALELDGGININLGYDGRNRDSTVRVNLVK